MSIIADAHGTLSLQHKTTVHFLKFRSFVFVVGRLDVIYFSALGAKWMTSGELRGNLNWVTAKRAKRDPTRLSMSSRH